MTIRQTGMPLPIPTSIVFTPLSCPEDVFIVARDFNKANLKTRIPTFYQHIECVTRAGSILDHCYSATHTKPSLALLSANLTTTPFVALSLLTETKTGNAWAQVWSMLVQPIWIHASRLLWSRGLGYVLDSLRQQYWCIRWFGEWVY